MSSNLFFREMILLVFFLSLSIPNFAFSEDLKFSDKKADSIKQRLYQAWKKQEQKVHSARLKYSQKETQHVKGKPFQAISENGKTISDPSYGIFTSDIERESERSVAWRRDKFRKEKSSFAAKKVPLNNQKKMFDFSDPSIITFLDGRKRPASSSVVVFDGKTLKAMSRQDDKKYSDGTLHDHSPVFQMAHIENYPFILTYRRMDPTCRLFDFDDLVFSNEERIHEGRSCFVVTHRPTYFQGRKKVPSDFSQHFWIDPNRNFTVVRVESYRKDRKLSQMDISYVLDEIHGWVLKSWKHHSLDHIRKISYSLTGKVSEYEINPEIDHSAFQLEFPVGTLFTNSKTRKWYIVRDTEPRLREVTDKEIKSGVSREELLRTATGKAKLPE